MKTLWTKILAGLESKISRHNFESWIQPIKPVSWDHKKLVLSVPNNFFVDWISDHYAELLRDLLSEHASPAKGVTPEIEFVIEHVAVEQVKKPALQHPAPARPKPRGKTITYAEAAREANLKENFRFETFVTGKSNEFAQASAVAVAADPGKKFNPLYIYGGVGLGKTHLMHSIGNQLLSKDSSLKVYYVSSEKFVNDLITSIQRGDMVSFRDKYRDLDLLMVDDVQFLAGKERTQEEFFHTFNTLYDAGKQIVISSDQFPKEMKNLEARLRSRFECGLIADIQAPELETKIAILLAKARQNGYELSNEVAAFLAGRVKSNNIRELEGCLARVMVSASLTARAIDIDLAAESIKGIYDQSVHHVDVRQIQKAVGEHYDLKPQDLKSAKRVKQIAQARQIAIYLCREYTQNSLPEIGRAFGGRDHTTILHAYRTVKDKLDNDTKLYNDLQKIKVRLDL